jgi:hypothetical protein
MTRLAEAVDELFNGKTDQRTHAFMIMVFPMNGKGRINFMSNLDRLDMVRALRVLIHNLEGGGHA